MCMTFSNQGEQDELAVTARILRSSALSTHMVRARGVTCYMRSIQPLLNYNHLSWCSITWGCMVVTIS